VDQLGYVEDAYAKARSLGKSPGAEIVRYQKKKGLGQFLKLFEDSEKGDLKVDLSIGPESGLKLDSGRLYLLPSFYAR
jgi:protease-4